MFLLEYHSSIDKFNHFWVMMSPPAGFAQFTKPESQVTRWSGQVRKTLGWVIVRVFAVILTNPLASQTIHFIEALFRGKKFCMFAWWDSSSTILKPRSIIWGIVCRSLVIRSLFSIDSAPQNQHRRSQKPPQGSLLWTNRRTRGVTLLGTIIQQMPIIICADSTQIKSDLAQHLVVRSDFICVKMPLLNRFSGHIHQLENLWNWSSELPERMMIDLKQMYRPEPCHDATSPILIMKACKVVFQYCKLNANSAKQCRNNEMPQTKAPIK